MHSYQERTAHTSLSSVASSSVSPQAHMGEIASHRSDICRTLKRPGMSFDVVIVVVVVVVVRKCGVNVSCRPSLGFKGHTVLVRATLYRDIDGVVSKNVWQRFP